MYLALVQSIHDTSTVNNNVIQPRFEENPVDRARQRGTLIASSVMTGLAVIFVIARTISRFWVIRNPGIDDCLLILAVLVLCGFLGGMGAAIANHMGYPTMSLSLGNLILLSKYAVVVEVLYYFNICFIKVSIVLTYLRFAVSKSLRRLCYATVAFHIMLCIASEFAVLLQTRPLSRMWTPEGGFGSSYQINIPVLFYVTAGINILTDFWILILPIKALSKIRRPRAEKIALFCIFGAGLFASIASIIRLHAIYVYVSSEDHLRNGLALLLWCVIEMSVAIMCASVTGIRPIWLWIIRRRSRKDLKVDGHKKSRAKMNSFFQQKNSESQDRGDEEALTQDHFVFGPAESESSDPSRDSSDPWPGSRGDSDTLFASQGSRRASKYSSARRSASDDPLNHSMLGLGATAGTQTPFEMMDFSHDESSKPAAPPAAARKNVPRSEGAPVARLPRRLSDDDYHKWVI